MPKPTNRLTGALLDSSMLSIAGAMHKVELEIGQQMSPADIYVEADTMQRNYGILPDSDPVAVLGLASDLSNLMVFVREKHTKSLVASANGYLKGDMKAGTWQPAFSSAVPMVVENDDHAPLTEPEAGITAPAD
ncbi:MAG TPA: hypothetical protein DD803_16045 [Alcaligenes faecalis]|nr:hypothetical protein [Alcaligenes faecalis]HBQ90948.1 hypothetical protein [Alcaligenes faecalis]